MKTKTSETKAESTIEEKTSSSDECPFDFDVCQKALVALKQIINNAQHGHKQLLDESTPISLFLHVHKIPRCTYLRLSCELPHPFTELDSREICLFVRDDDVNGRDYERTVRRYKSMIEKFKLPFHVDVMTLKQLNQELVPYEAKRKLCARYDIFLADRRIMTSLMRGQLLGKHFRYHGKMPLGINVFNKDLKQRLITLCSSTYGRMAGTGPLFSIQFTNLHQSINHGMENLKALCQTLGKELPGRWSNVEHAFFYGNNLQSLPIYYSTHNKNDVKKLNLPVPGQDELTHIGELSTAEKDINVVVQSSGRVSLTKKSKLSNNIKKKKSTKRLQKTWTKGLQQQQQTRVKKSKKEKTSKNNDDTPVFNVDDKPLVDAEFVKRVATTKLAEKDKKPKHVEQIYAEKPAPRAEKRKRLLAAAKQASKENETNDVNDAPTLVDADSEERKIKSGGRSKKKVRINV